MINGFIVEQRSYIAKEEVILFSNSHLFSLKDIHNSPAKTIKPKMSSAFSTHSINFFHRRKTIKTLNEKQQNKNKGQKNIPKHFRFTYSHIPKKVKSIPFMCITKMKQLSAPETYSPKIRKKNLLQ